MLRKGEFTDIHCHILPKVDDGSGSLEESLDMLRTAMDEGIGTIIATPHNYASHRSVTADKVRDTVNKLNGFAKEHNIPISIYGGNEIYYRTGIADLLEEGEILTLAGSRYVLVEFDPGVEFSYLRDGMGELLRYGYFPILAHAERYDCLYNKKGRIRELSNSGIYFQINASSCLQGFMSEDRKRIKLLIKEECIHFVGTDAHSNRTRSPKIKQGASYLYKKLGDEWAERVLYTNPAAILNDRRI